MKKKILKIITTLIIAITIEATPTFAIVPAPIIIPSNNSEKTINNIQNTKHEKINGENEILIGSAVIIIILLFLIIKEP